jgi:hypothetical protein
MLFLELSTLSGPKADVVTYSESPSQLQLSSLTTAVAAAASFPQLALLLSAGLCAFAHVSVIADRQLWSFPPLPLASPPSLSAEVMVAHSVPLPP